VARQMFHVEGLSELEDALAEFPKATAKNVLKRMLMKAGQPVADDAEVRARRRSGKLKQSFGVSTKLSRRQRSQHKQESMVEVFAGPGALVQAITEEFGTSSQAPHPMLRPAWDSKGPKALDSMRDDLADEIDKAAQRAARKAAKQLALIKA
jgi:HK97 gp10 family phage protein